VPSVVESWSPAKSVERLGSLSVTSKALAKFRNFGETRSMTTDSDQHNEQDNGVSSPAGDAVTNDETHRLEEAQLPIAKPDDNGMVNKDFQALGVCVPPMTAAEEHDWEQAQLLFLDQENVAIAKSLDQEMITRQVRGKQFMKKDKQRLKVS
jgi:hypothetical protein